MVEKVAVYRIEGRVISTPVQTVFGRQFVNGVPLTQIRQKAEWVNVFTKEKNNVR